MKKTLLICVGICIAALFTGCATPYPQGMLYTNLKLPVDATSNMAKAPKVGTAECVSYLGMIAIGDVSIDTAMKNGGIKKIYYVDWEVENILGLIGKYKVTVYGE